MASIEGIRMTLAVLFGELTGEKPDRGAPKEESTCFDGLPHRSYKLKASDMGGSRSLIGKTNHNSLHRKSAQEKNKRRKEIKKQLNVPYQWQPSTIRNAKGSAPHA